ncbi:MAG: arginine--tRNA ligase [Chloroflexi bacterium]|nr:arginine--tRNA ligase [Chloroflexota bacterium]
MLKHELAQVIAQSIAAAQAAGALPAFAMPVVDVERPREAGHGDYSTTVAMKLAKEARMAPLKIAQAIAAHVPSGSMIARSEAVAPGFLNMHLDAAFLARQVDGILQAGETFGNITLGGGKRAQVEFVSANPTGPLHMGGARNAVIGDTVASILAAAGYDVEREFYVNDAGSQIRKFGGTMYARYQQALGFDVPFPEGGYQGEYIKDYVKEIIARDGEKYLQMPPDEATRALGQLGTDAVIAEARRTLAEMGVRFNVWFSERSLYTNGTFDTIYKLLETRALLLEKDGAIWFAAQEFGEDKDAVIVRSASVVAEPSERPTYFASDIAYMWNKFVERQFDKVVYVWGSDHHADVPRVKAAKRALGIPGEIDIIIYQFVNIMKSGEQVRMSKRKGDFVALKDVLRDVGKDAMRFMLLTRSADNVIEFDLALAVEQSDQNPVYYVQYAHARIASILRTAAERGQLFDDGDTARLSHPAEQALIRKMLELPEQIELAARNLTPHLLTHYAQDLAATFHSFYKQCRVLPGESVDEALSKARMKLVKAAKQVLARTLHLLGMDAPDQM